MWGGWGYNVVSGAFGGYNVRDARGCSLSLIAAEDGEDERDPGSESEQRGEVHGNEDTAERLLETLVKELREDHELHRGRRAGLEHEHERQRDVCERELRRLGGLGPSFFLSLSISLSLKSPEVVVVVISL